MSVREMGRGARIGAGHEFVTGVIYTYDLPCNRRRPPSESYPARKIPGTRQSKEAGTREVKVVSQA